MTPRNVFRRAMWLAYYTVGAIGIALIIHRVVTGVPL